MNCTEVPEFIERRIAEGISREEEIQLREHLGTCERCTVLLEFLEPESLRDEGDEDLTRLIMNQTSGQVCLEVEQILCSFVDHSLEKLEAQMVEDHLSGCAACRELADLIPVLGRDLASLRDIEPDQAFSLDVLRVTSQAVPPEPGLWQRFTEFVSEWVKRQQFPLEAAYAGSLVFVTLLGGQSGALFTELPVRFSSSFQTVIHEQLPDPAPRLTGSLKAAREEVASRLRERFEAGGGIVTGSVEKMKSQTQGLKESTLRTRDQLTAKARTISQKILASYEAFSASDDSPANGNSPTSH